MQTPINANVQAALQAAARDSEFALALQTYFAADVAPETICNALINATLEDLRARDSRRATLRPSVG